MDTFVTLKRSKGITRSLKIFILLAVLFFNISKSNACSPLNTPVLTNSLIVGNNLLLDFQSVTIWLGCSGYNVEVELKCASQALTGIGPFYYTSPPYTKTGNPQTLPQMTVSLAGLCAGQAYQFRWRENWNNGGAVSPWSAVGTFTMAGAPIPTTMTVTATPSAICFPQTSQLSASVSGGCGGGTPLFAWTPTTGLSCTNCANPIANPTTTTIYTVTATGSNPASCWSASAAITIVSFTAAPTVGTASSVPNLCAGQTNQVSISSSSGLIQWQQSINGGPYVDVAGATGTTMVTPTLSAGMYCYRLVAAGCGGSITSAPVCTSVTPTPTISVNTASLCQGQVLTLIGNGAQTYNWPLGITQTGPNTGTTSPPVTTNYTISGTTNGCSSSVAITVTVQAYPIFTMGNNGPVCKGNPLNLTNTGTGVYNWSGPGGFVSNVQNPTIAVANPSNSGVYNLTVSVNGCATTGSMNASVLDPTVSAAGGGTYCAGTNVVLSANSSTVISYSWTGPNAFASAQQNPTITNVPLTASGVYTVVVNDGTCTKSATTSLNILPLPSPTITSNAPICEQTSLTINASGGVSYLFNGPLAFSSTSESNVINPASAFASGVYSVSVTDVNGCVAGATLNVVVMPSPSINISGSKVCAGQSTSLSATGGGTYNWTGPNGFTSTLQAIPFSYVTANDTGYYVVTVTGVNGCTLSAGTRLLAFSIPNPGAMCTPVACVGSKVEFTGSGGYLYSWIGPYGFVSQVQSPVINSVPSVSCSGVYTLGVIDENGCQAYTTTTLTVKPLPTATISATTNSLCAPYCGKYTLNSGSQLQNTQWDMNNTGFSQHTVYEYCFSTSGGRTLRAMYTDNNGCTNFATYSISVSPKPKADFHFGPGDPVENDQIDFTDASSGPSINKWEWYFSENVKNATYQNPSYVFTKAGSYPVALIISNKYGCKDTVIKSVNVGEDANIFIPSAFSPNGDGVNDLFMPKGFGVVKYKMEIFDRWGERIFGTEDFTTGWDGTVKGKLAKQESFVYKITVQNIKGASKDFTGHVTLLK